MGNFDRSAGFLVCGLAHRTRFRRAARPGARRRRPQSGVPLPAPVLRWAVGSRLAGAVRPERGKAGVLPAAAVAPTRVAERRARGGDGRRAIESEWASEQATERAGGCPAVPGCWAAR